MYWTVVAMSTLFFTGCKFECESDAGDKVEKIVDKIGDKAEDVAKEVNKKKDKD